MNDLFDNMMNFNDMVHLIVGEKVNFDEDLYTSYKKAFCYALASKEFIRKDIDKIFNKDKITFLNAFKNSNIKNSKLFKSYDVNTEIYSQKVVGILEHDLIKNDFNNITNLYSKAFRKIYRNLRDKDIVTPSDIYMFSKDNNMCSFASSIYFFYLTKSIYTDSVEIDEMIKEIADEIALFDDFKNIYFSKKLSETYIERINNLRNKLNIQIKEYSLSELNDKIIALDLYELGYIDDINSTDDIVGDKFDIAQRNGTYSKFVGVNLAYFKYLGYNIDDFGETKFTKSEIKEILMNLVFTNVELSFSDIETIGLFINVIHSMALDKDYRKSREEYVKFINEESILTVNKLQSDLRKSKDELLDYKNQLKTKEKFITESNTKLLKQLEALKKENERLKEDIRKTEPLKQEVVKLRNLSFSSFNNGKLKPNKIPYDIDKLKALNLAIIGGTNTWINKMKVKLPNSKFITNDNKNTDFKFLKNIDMVFINIKMPHSLYFKVKSTIDKFDIKYDFIDNKENIEYSLVDLYEKSIKA